MQDDGAPQQATDTIETSSPTKSGLLAIGSASVLSACGGNDGLNTSSLSSAAPPPETAPSSAQLLPIPITEQAAARFLMQAGMGASRTEIKKVQTLGYSAWIDQQMQMPASLSRWDWLVTKGMNASEFRNSQAGFDSCAWRKLIQSPDTLRQRVCFALSEIFVISIDGLVNGGGWKAFAAAHYLDLLEANCFGNYRDLLQKISTSTSMSLYLTYRGNTKFNPATGALPDENYARELMQLFSIGLVNLNQDGSVITQNGVPVETYQLEDITGLARVFTGWDFDLAQSNTSTPDYHRRPLRQYPNKHETGASSFLGKTIPAGISGEEALKLSLDILFAHPNVAPFIGKQLIQKLVTSNPSPAYVARISAVFNANAFGVRGDLGAVVKAILLDPEARGRNLATSSLTEFVFNPQAGKIREPILRFCAWARAFNASSPSDTWRIGDTSDAGTKLGQSPLRSPSVFNFYRPGYVPPNTAIANAGLIAPEMQIVNESSVVGYLNFMQNTIDGMRGGNDLKADYSGLMALAHDPVALVGEMNLLLAAGQLDLGTLQRIQNAIGTMPFTTDRAKLLRIHAALTLVLATPEFIVLK
ncbi:DUF1800 domain-containing protein [Undibacterium sp. FT137W]|uniref:DUF1800 domain-containing protein n=2 Tax=Undibacterium fentianense TaxID=2828728 RepID=A0A941E0X2_9BURK|nr:DUF1800 domain-containing protein [Undibacterium fentianense]